MENTGRKVSQALEKASEITEKVMDLRVILAKMSDKQRLLFNELSGEESKIEETIAKHSKIQSKLVKYSVSFYELSQQAKEIYLKAKKKKKTEIQRRMLRHIFASLTVDANNRKITITYTKPFQILSELVKITNRSKVVINEEKTKEKFELPNQINIPIQTGAFLHAYPEMRELVDDVRTFYAQLPASQQYYIPNFA